MNPHYVACRLCAGYMQCNEPPSCCMQAGARPNGSAEFEEMVDLVRAQFKALSASRTFISAQVGLHEAHCRRGGVCGELLGEHS